MLNGMHIARMELTVYHAYFEKLRWYYGIFQFQMIFTKNKSIKSLWLGSFVLTLKLKSGKDSVFFSVALRKVFHERPPDEDSI